MRESHFLLINLYNNPLINEAHYDENPFYRRLYLLPWPGLNRQAQSKELLTYEYFTFKH